MSFPHPDLRNIVRGLANVRFAAGGLVAQPCDSSLQQNRKTLHMSTWISPHGHIGALVVPWWCSGGALVIYMPVGGYPRGHVQCSPLLLQRAVTGLRNKPAGSKTYIGKSPNDIP